MVRGIAEGHPAWGHRKVWAMARHAGHLVTPSTVLRILDDEGLLLWRWSPGSNFTVRAPDPHRFDNDGDGVGCET